MSKTRQVLSGVFATVAVTALVAAGTTPAQALPMPPIKLSKIVTPPRH